MKLLPKRISSIWLMPIFTILLVTAWCIYAKWPKFDLDLVAAKQNLLANSDFELWQNQDQIKDWGIKAETWKTVKIQKSKGYVKGAGLRVDSKSKQEVSIETPLIPVQANQSYFFKTFYLTDTKINLIAELTDNNGQIEQRLIKFLPDYDYDWSSMSGLVQTDDKTQFLRWRIVVLDKGFIELDSAYVLADSSLAPKQEKFISSNLLNNSTPILHKDEQAQLNATFADYKLTVSNCLIGQSGLDFPEIPVAASELYQFDFSYQASMETELELEIKDNNGNYTYATIDSNEISKQWLKRSITIETPLNAQAMAIILRTKENGSFSIQPGYSLHKLKDTAHFSEARLSITFDDGWLSSYNNGAALVEKYGMPATFYIVPNLIGKTDYMETSHLNDLLKRGHQLASHTYSHLDLSKLSSPSIHKELDMANQFLLHNFKISNSDLASPYGKLDARGKQLVMQKHHSHRGTEHGINTKQNYDIYNLKGFFIDKEKTLEDLKRQIEAAKAHNAWLILIYHQVDDSNIFFATTETEFKRHLKLISESGIKVETVAQTLNFLAKQ